MNQCQKSRPDPIWWLARSGFVFLTALLLVVGHFGLFGVKEAYADQQTDIAPSTESHTASVSTFTERGTGTVTALATDVGDPGAETDYLAYELLDTATTDDVTQQVNYDLTSLSITGSQIDEITFKGEVFLTGGWTTPGPETDPFECGNVGDAYVQIYNGTSWDNVGTVVIAAETGFNDGAGGGTAALYDAEGLTFTKTKTGGFTDSYLDGSNILSMRFYWVSIDCSVGESGTPDGTFVWDYTLIDVTYSPNTTIGDGTSPANKSVEQSSSDNAVDAFTLVTGGTDTVTAMTVTFSGTDVTDVAASGVKIYRDDGGTPNEWDATDTLIATTSFSGATATFSSLSISVTSTETQYLITYDIDAGATVTDTLQGAVTAATVTKPLVNNDTVDATLTVIAGTTPAAPSGLAGTSAITKVDLTWTDNSGNETRFELERVDDGDPSWDGTCDGSGEVYSVLDNNIAANSTSYSDTTVTLGDTYCYRIRASNSFGDSGYNYSATITVTGPTPPTGLTVVTGGETQLNLTWTDASSDENGFKIERVVGAGCTFTDPSTDTIATILRDSAQSASTGGFVYYADTGLPSGTTFCYRVRAFARPFGAPADGSGDIHSTYSNTDSATTTSAAADSTDPGQVTDLGIAPAEQRRDSITLEWTAPPDDAGDLTSGPAASYDIRYSMLPIVDGAPGPGQVDWSDTVCTDPTRPVDCVVQVTGEPVPETTGNLERFTVTSLRSNTIYYFALKSDDEVPNTSLMSNVAGGDYPRDFGTATAGTSSTTLEDTAKSWTVNEWVSATVAITSGAGSGQTRIVVSNTVDTLTVDQAWTTTPSSGDSYIVALDGKHAGRASLLPNFNLGSVSFAPSPSDPTSVFEDDTGAPLNLYRWNSSGLGTTDGCYESSPIGISDCSPQVAIATVTPGEGYFLIGSSDNPVIDAPAASTPVNVVAGPTCGLTNTYTIPLELGWNMIGNPFDTGSVTLDDTNAAIRLNGTTCYTFSAAVAANLVGSVVYGFNGATYDTTTTMERWKGLWFQVVNNDVFDGTTYELILKRP